MYDSDFPEIIGAHSGINYAGVDPVCFDHPTDRWSVALITRETLLSPEANKDRGGNGQISPNQINQPPAFE